MSHLYYHEQLDIDALQAGTTVEVVGAEARHAVQVARLRVGEATIIGNGAGVLADATVLRATRESFTAQITHVRVHPPQHPRLVLVQALAKANRDVRAIEQATEFGVDAIVPWQAARSIPRWNAAADSARAGSTQPGHTRWVSVAREAAKQSLRSWRPEVRSLAHTHELCRAARGDDTWVLVLDPRGETTLSALLTANAQQPAPSEIWVVVGPEGGISAAEIDAFRSAGAPMVRLGSTILRTSSAGPAALVMLAAALDRW